ncbi:MAG: hypothetical protein U1F56_23680 [Rubrivivax sp.]
MKPMRQLSGAVLCGVAATWVVAQPAAPVPGATAPAAAAPAASAASAPAAAASAPEPLKADVELKTPDGRAILVKTDGTWVFVEAEAKPPIEPSQMAVLKMLDLRPVPDGCEYQFELDNRQPYEVRSLIPDIKVYRKGGAFYVENTIPFGRILPGDRQLRRVVVRGLSCPDIERLQVAGGDRCDMGDLNKFTDGKGLCLARVRVESSDKLTFDK